MAIRTRVIFATVATLLMVFCGYSYADDIKVCGKAAENIASGLPAKINKHLRLDSALCAKLSGDRVVMIYGVTVIDDNLSWDARSWREVQKEIIRDGCADPEARALFRFVSVVRQNWVYKNGKSIGSITMRKQDCRP